jgi:hypothetical protein
MIYLHKKRKVFIEDLNNIVFSMTTQNVHVTYRISPDPIGIKLTNAI